MLVDAEAGVEVGILVLDGAVVAFKVLVFGVVGTVAFGALQCT